jgi:hypothetical protein
MWSVNPEAKSEAEIRSTSADHIAARLDVVGGIGDPEEEARHGQQ